jgi:hypothetical protein
MKVEVLALAKNRNEKNEVLCSSYRDSGISLIEAKSL